jgi:hypothetical protein
VAASNEYTKSFCETDQYKNAKKITEITRDSIYQAGKEEMIKTHQGFQSLNIREIPSFQQHEANQAALSNARYREDWDEEKEAIYFPAHVSQGYEEKQRAQDAVSDAKYKKDAFDKMKTNKFNIADSEQYQKNEELRKHQSESQYKAEYEKERNNFTNMAVTKEMEQAKQLNEYKVRTFTFSRLCKNVFKLPYGYFHSSIRYLIRANVYVQAFFMCIRP